MECSRQPTQGKSDIFAAAGLCWPRALGTLLLQLPTAPRRQGIEHEFPQLVACNLFLLEMLGGGQENRKAVTSSVVSLKLEGFLSHNDLSMANCSDSACPNNKVCLHMSQLAQICHALWGSKALGREKGGSHSTPVGATSLVQPVCSRLVFLPFCPHPVTPSHKFLSLWKLDGRSLLSRRTSTVGVFHFAVPV